MVKVAGQIVLFDSLRPADSRPRPTPTATPVARPASTPSGALQGLAKHPLEAERPAAAPRDRPGRPRVAASALPRVAPAGIRKTVLPKCPVPPEGEGTHGPADTARQEIAALGQQVRERIDAMHNESAADSSPPSAERLLQEAAALRELALLVSDLLRQLSLRGGQAAVTLTAN